MKKNILWCGLILLAFTSCLSRMKAIGDNQIPVDGWYVMENVSTNSIKSKPIATASDFTDMRVDSCKVQDSNLMLYTIVGKVKDVKKWADVTEKAIGKNLGFLYEGRLVCTPRVNARIESGMFMVSFPPSATLQDVESVLHRLQQSQK